MTASTRSRRKRSIPAGASVAYSPGLARPDRADWESRHDVCWGSITSLSRCLSHFRFAHERDGIADTAALRVRARGRRPAALHRAIGRSPSCCWMKVQRQVRRYSDSGLECEPATQVSRSYPNAGEQHLDGELGETPRLYSGCSWRFAKLRG